MLGSLPYVVLISTKVINKITVTQISTILCLIFVDFDNPAQRKRCEFSKSYARAAMTTLHLNLIFAIFCRTIATIRNFAKLQPLSKVNPLVFLISLCVSSIWWCRLSTRQNDVKNFYPLWMTERFVFRSVSRVQASNKHIFSKHSQFIL